MNNTLHYGDCLNVLRELPDDLADLIYLDPPFNSNRDYNAFFTSAKGEGSTAQITAFEDTWHWGPQAEEEFGKLLHNPNAGLLGETLMPALRSFLGENDMMAYLTMMASRLVEMRRVLKGTGSLYLHCAPTASHYLKVVLDGVFGKENFRNEIVWRRTNSHNKTTKQFGPIHDCILFYSKSYNFTFNTLYTPYTKAYIEDRFKYNDAYGRYQLNYLTGPGTRKGESGKEWGGFNPTIANRHWAIPKSLRKFLPEDIDTTLAQLDYLYSKKFIVFPKKEGGQPMYKQYIGQGMPYQDIWSYQPNTKGVLIDKTICIDEDVKYLENDKERLGYPTQKPVGLLERIIRASSNPGDVVLDPFCGCGTAVHAAQKLGRQWIGIDISHLAVSLIKKRMSEAFPDCEFKVSGTPEDVESARFLAESNGLEGRYQFQYWALSLVSAIPANDKKKGADSGSDGFIWAYDAPDAKKPYKINISVKSGKIPANHIRELGGMLGKGSIEMCLLITLEAPSKKMKADALSYGKYEYPNGKEFQRIQILTIEELLEGKRLDYLDYGVGQAMPKKAKKEVKKQEQFTLS